MESSCLQLGYYLASWGMLRGSSYLFRRTNLRHYVDAVEVIERHNPLLKGADADQYGNADTRNAIIEACSDLGRALLPEGGRSLTLVSKVAMGVWGVLPSFDTYFVKTFRGLAESKAERRAFQTIGDASLLLLGEFYEINREEISRLSDSFRTLDFTTGEFIGRPIPLAKTIDMYGFAGSYAG